MRITNLTMLAFELNHAIDTGKYSDIAVADVSKAIGGEVIFDFLRERLKQDIDLSHLDDKKRALLIEEWRNYQNSIDAERKFGIARSGLCLLLAYVIQGIQQRQDANPKVLG